MDIRFVALEKWPVAPTPSHRRVDSPFRAKWAQTIDLLETELNHLKAKEIVIQADCDRSQIRLDGLMRADAKLRGPGVVLSFESKHGPLSYPCDQYKDWQDNVRAIALSLEKLRAVDRYGVTRQAEQYKGWARLPDKSQSGPFATPSAACDWLTKELAITVPVPSCDEHRATLRKAAMAAFHPDRNAGDDARWKLWTAAAAVLAIEV